MKRFIILTAIGAVGSAIALFACGFLSDKLVAAAKYGTAGSLSLTAGTAFGLFWLLLALPARLFSLGSDRPPMEIVGLILTFAFWGALFGLGYEGLKRLRQKS
jgi:hypothetical protein